MMLRRLHTYMAIVSAPIIVFFCLTGALQLFDWHEPRGAYHPPAWIEKLGMLHKKQRFAVRGGGGGPGGFAGGPAGAPPIGIGRPDRGAAHAPDSGPDSGLNAGPNALPNGGPDAGPGAMPDAPPNRARLQPPAGGHREPPTTLRVLLLRWVFLLATLSLVASTVMGAWIGLTHARRKRLCWALLALGTAVPVLMVAL